MLPRALRPSAGSATIFARAPNQAPKRRASSPESSVGALLDPIGQLRLDALFHPRRQTPPREPPTLPEPGGSPPKRSPLVRPVWPFEAGQTGTVNRRFPQLWLGSSAISTRTTSRLCSPADPPRGGGPVHLSEADMNCPRVPGLDCDSRASGDVHSPVRCRVHRDHRHHEVRDGHRDSASRSETRLSTAAPRRPAPSHPHSGACRPWS